jgi:3'(2'), 5'-bisphosphate nucleotidase
MSAPIPSSSLDLSKLIEQVIEIADSVGEKVRLMFERYQKNGDMQLDHKSDQSPVTEADIYSHQLLTEQLKSLLPEAPILSEEETAPPLATRQTWKRYWLVDPLDGTREFLNKKNEFTINIALVENNQPLLGVINVPVARECYFAFQSSGAFKQDRDHGRKGIMTRQLDTNHVHVLASRYHAVHHLHELLEKIPQHDVVHAGSALKFCWIAEGKADIYPRLGPTSEWDTAAGQCIVEEAGGKVVDMQYQPLNYNMRESLINPSFIAVGDPRYDWRSCFDDSDK